MRPLLDLNKIGPLLLLVCGIYLSGGERTFAQANNLPADELVRAECEARLRRNSSEVERALLLLYCNVRPLVATFQPLRRALASSEAQMDGDDEWNAFANQVDGFYKESVYLLDRSEFCTYPVIKRLKALCNEISAECGLAAAKRGSSNGNRNKKRSNLLHIAFDLLAIEFHERCLMAVLPKLPPVPYLVRDVVKIYITGADKGLVVADLNSEVAVSGASDHSSLAAPPPPTDNRLVMSGLSVGKFDVEAAIKSQGPLEQVMSLLISFNDKQTDEDKVQKFKDTCKEFVMEIEQRWQSFEMLNTMIATAGNGIRHLNNYVMRSLIPTRYADVCSRLSLRS